MRVRRRSGAKTRSAKMDEHGNFMKRISKSLYYGDLPTIPCLSLPVMELSADLFSESQKGKSLKRLYLEDATELARNACVSPCSLVLALVYLERLKSCNPEYVANMAPSDLFLISLMVSNKFKEDDGEEYSVFMDEWAASAGISVSALNQMERKFLKAIDWRVFVGKEQFNSTLQWLEHQIAQKQGRQRGWFTYADLANISNTGDHIGLIKCLTTVYAALSISYLASVSALMASSIITTHTLAALSLTNPLGRNIFDNAPDYYTRTEFNHTGPPSMDPQKNDSIIYANDIIDSIKDFRFYDEANYSKTLDGNFSMKRDAFNVPVKITFLKNLLKFIDSQRTHIFRKILYLLDQNNLQSGLRENLEDNFYNNRNTCCENVYSPMQIHLWSIPVSC